MQIEISDYAQFLNVIDNQAFVDMTEVKYINELKECQESHNRACCSQSHSIQKNCNEQLYKIIDEAATNDSDFKSKIKIAFDCEDITFKLNGKTITL